VGRGSDTPEVPELPSARGYSSALFFSPDSAHLYTLNMLCKERNWSTDVKRCQGNCEAYEHMWCFSLGYAQSVKNISLLKDKRSSSY
jgi:hypothetical protein